MFTKSDWCEHFYEYLENCPDEDTFRVVAVRDKTIKCEFIKTCCPRGNFFPVDRKVKHEENTEITSNLLDNRMDKSYTISHQRYNFDVIHATLPTTG